MQTISVAEVAGARIPSRASLQIGGLTGAGTPVRIIDEIVRQQKCNLIVIANDTASPGVGISKLISAQLVQRMIASHIGLNPEARREPMCRKALRFTSSRLIGTGGIPTEA
jgi:acetate CoA/acetoacetate CoA-transferase alpha subunit